MIVVEQVEDPFESRIFAPFTVGKAEQLRAVCRIECVPEQDRLALAMRLAAHRLVAERTESTPVLVLDDVLSELDPDRATALLANLPPGQIVITTASPLPPAAEPERIIEIASGAIVA